MGKMKSFVEGGNTNHGLLMGLRVTYELEKPEARIKANEDANGQFKKNIAIWSGARSQLDTQLHRG